MDLSDPAAPATVGRVHSTSRTYGIYPLSASMVLGIGTLDPSWSAQSVAFQLFDVTVDSAPSVAHELVLSEPGYTRALNERRVLSIDSSLSVMAFPFQSYDTGATSLEAYRISLSEGFTHLGGVVPRATDASLQECLEILGYPSDPASLAQLELDPSFRDSLLESCRTYDTDTVRRALLRGKAVFAIGDRRVTAYAVEALVDPALSQVILEQ